MYDLRLYVAVAEDGELDGDVGDVDAEFIHRLPVLELERIEFTKQCVCPRLAQPMNAKVCLLEQVPMALEVMEPSSSGGTPFVMASSALRSSMKLSVLTFTAVHRLLACSITRMSATHTYYLVLASISYCPLLPLSLMTGWISRP